MGPAFGGLGRRQDLIGPTLPLPRSGRAKNREEPRDLRSLSSLSISGGVSMYGGGVVKKLASKKITLPPSAARILANPGPHKSLQRLSRHPALAVLFVYGFKVFGHPQFGKE